MTTRQVCSVLHCCARSVFTLRNARYPEGHALAGERVLGTPVWRNKQWHYDEQSVRLYRDWLVDGCPIHNKKPSRMVNAQRVEERLRRAMQQVQHVNG